MITPRGENPYLDNSYKRELDAVKEPNEFQRELDRVRELDKYPDNNPRLDDEYKAKLDAYNEAIEKSYPDNNPKQAMGAKKCPLHLVPPALMIAAADGMKNGGDKYGPYNFRDSKISASVYVGAFLRHLFAYWDGEDYAQDSGILHVNHLASGLAVMLDAMNSGTFVDDRPAKGGAPEMLDKWERKHDAANVGQTVTIPKEALEGMYPHAFPQPGVVIKIKEE